MADANHMNADEVIDWLRRLIESFNFSLPGKDQNLGRDLAHVLAGQIAERSAQLGRGADAAEWPPNPPVYAALKAEHYGWPDRKPNYRTGQMLSQESLFGRTTVQDQLVEVVYGTGVAASRTFSPLDNRTPSEKKADESTTDLQKAEWATPKRPFFDFDDVIEEAVIEEADKALNTYILDAG